jgi:hypothetical protein
VSLALRERGPEIKLFAYIGISEADLLCIGFLIIDTCFPDQDRALNFDDLLDFNEQFRFWQHPYEKHEDRYKVLLANCPVDMRVPNGRVFSDSNTMEIYFERWASLLEIPIQDENGRVWRLFPESWSKQAHDWVSGNRNAWESGWIVYADNRSFVWTCAIAQNGWKELEGRFFPNFETSGSSFGHWIKLLNVDSPKETPEKTHHSTQFEREWARERTYRRWEEYGTLYGFNYHCGAMLAPPLNDPEGPPLWQHFSEIYFDQTLLLLFLRVGSFRFSRRLSCISAAARDQRERIEPTDDWQRDFSDLRWLFALFTNLYQFPLLSNQQQGIEMYELARRYMDVNELFQEVQEEIRSSHEYLEIRTGQEQTHMSMLLTVVATAGLALGLASSLLGMNILIDDIMKIIKGPLSNDITVKLIGVQFLIFLIVFLICSIFLICFILKSKYILGYFREQFNRSSWPQRYNSERNAKESSP